MGKINKIYTDFTHRYSDLIYKNQFIDYDDFCETLFDDLKEEVEEHDIEDKYDILKNIILDYLEEYSNDKFSNELQVVIGNIYYCPTCKIAKYSELELIQCDICLDNFV